METKIIKIDVTSPNWDKLLEPAAEVLRAGGLVAFPTETVYGLGANALNPKAVENIYKAKGRPSDNPLIVHIAETGALNSLTATIPPVVPGLMEAFWPGPLTMVFPKSDIIPGIITAGLDTVAVRMPSHPIALALIRMSGIPIAAPSANSSGKPSPTLARHVIEDLSGKVDIIIDGGSTRVGVESTVLDVTSDPPMILRPGGISLEQLQRVLGNISTDPSIASGHTGSTPPRSPGMKYRHYAPKASLLLVKGPQEQVVCEISRRADSCLTEGKAVGILAADETAASYAPSLHDSCRILSLGSRQRPETLAANLFKRLREFDEKGVDVIFAETPDSDGIGMAVLNRLMKAAGGNIITV